MSVPDAPVPSFLPQEHPSCITLKWDVAVATEQDPSPITDFIIHCNDLPEIVLPAHTRYYTIPDLVQTCIYSIKLYARNEHGLSEPVVYPEYQPGCDKYGFV